VGGEAQFGKRPLPSQLLLKKADPEKKIGLLQLNKPSRGFSAAVCL
jgi:hypothetical protein